METQDDRRRHRRLSVDESFTVRFRVNDQACQEVPLTDLGAGGCCLRLTPQDAEGIERGSQVSTLYFDHPQLPPVPLQGRVARILGKVPGKVDGYVLVALEFTGMNPRIEALLEQFVADRLSPEQDAGPTPSPGA